jgi:polysaccharide biosynthesis protein PslH
VGHRIIYVRGGAVRSFSGGADLISSSVKRMLDERYGAAEIGCVYMDELGKAPGKPRSLARAAAGRYPFYGRAASALVKAGARAGAELLFVDQSVYGLACAEAKAVSPGISCAVLFHNDERRYYAERAARGGKAHDLLLLPAIARAERAAMRKADLCIALSARDAMCLEEDYGRRPELVLPPGLEDRFNGGVSPAAESEEPGLRMLFVGSAFAPNLDAVRWFVKNVLPLVPGKLKVVGSGFEAHRAELGRGRVEIAGFVPDLGAVYSEADCVVSPVSWGSGIKVKTAEAFMHGMPLVGCAEALEGYDPEAAGAIRADDAESFAAALRSLESPESRQVRGRAARRYFLDALSYPAAKEKMDAALAALGL